MKFWLSLLTPSSPRCIRKIETPSMNLSVIINVFVMTVKMMKDFPGSPAVCTLHFPRRRLGVSPVRELGFHVSTGEAKSK